MQVAQHKPVGVLAPHAPGVQSSIRQATDAGLRYLRGDFGTQSTTQSLFFGRAPRLYNSIPAEIRSASTLLTFRQKLKLWVNDHVPME